MSVSIDPNLSDAAILTRGVESVLRKLVRFLIGRISLVKLQEMLRVIYLQEAEHFLSAESSANVSLTRLGVVTGVDTRTLRKIKQNDCYSNPIHRTEAFLKELTPAASVIDTWTSQAPFIDENTARPRALPLVDGPASFEALVASTISGRGITSKSLLNRLIESGAVELDEDGRVARLVRDSYLPQSMNDHIGFVELGLSAVGNLIDTLNFNLKALELGKPRLFQRGAWIFRLAPENVPLARSQLETLLRDTENRAREILQELDEPRPQSNQRTAGVSLFYFEEGSAEIPR